MSALVTSHFSEEHFRERGHDQIIGDSPVLKSVLERSNAWLDRSQC